MLKILEKNIQKKLLLALVGIILVIKIIKIKLFWLLPMLVGANAAKKLLLKVLLFLFPALAHIFKLCSYYHESYHKTNFHHHHHQINHHHTVRANPWSPIQSLRVLSRCSPLMYMSRFSHIHQKAFRPSITVLRCHRTPLTTTTGPIGSCPAPALALSK